MEPCGSLACSQQPATCPHPEPDQSSPCSHFFFKLKYIPLVFCIFTRQEFSLLYDRFLFSLLQVAVHLKHIMSVLRNSAP
jgi:hypothetical protein